MTTPASTANALGACAITGRVELLAMLLEHPTTRSVQGPLNFALGEACNRDSAASGKGCLALEKAGAQWTHDPKLSKMQTNCAQIAALCGPLVHLVGSHAFGLALMAKHPPRKVRGAWTDWQSMDMTSERRSLAEKAILHAMAPVDEPEQGAARRPLRV